MPGSVYTVPSMLYQYFRLCEPDASLQYSGLAGRARAVVRVPLHRRAVAPLVVRDVAIDVPPAALEGDAALRGDRDAEAVCAGAEAALGERRPRREQPCRVRRLQHSDPCTRGRPGG